MNKKAIELSVNFLVTIILAITIFIFGIMFARNLLGGAEDITRMTEEDLDAKMDQLLCPGDEPVCFGVRTKTARRGELVIFGVKVLNIYDTAMDFTVDTDLNGAILKGDTTKTDYTDLNTDSKLDILPRVRTENIDTNRDKKIAVGVQIPKQAASGKYILDVKVCEGTVCEAGNIYGYNKFYVEVP